MKSQLIETSFIWIAKGFAMLLLLVAPIKPTLIAVGTLVIIDMVTGIWASMKRGEEFSSSKLRVTVSKTGGYMATIIVAHILETWLVPDIPCVKIVAGLIGFTEGKSFFENIHAITGIDFWSAIVRKLHGDSTKFFPKSKDRKK